MKFIENEKIYIFHYFYAIDLDLKKRFTALKSLYSVKINYGNNRFGISLCIFSDNEKFQRKVVYT